MAEKQREAEQPVVLVTGGVRGVGQGIAKYLLGSYRVVVIDQLRDDGEELARVLASEGDIRFIRADVSDERQVQKAISRVGNWFGRIDAVINNAAIAEPYTGPFEYLALEDWQHYLNVNLTGAFLVCREAIELLRQNRGAIVNIASTRCLQSEPQCEAYAASKGGLVALTHALAITYSGQVRVNCISPGWIDVGHLDEHDHRNPVHLTEACHNQHPAGRVGRASDIATMVGFLISDKSGFITGQNIVVDGGMTRKMIYE